MGIRILFINSNDRAWLLRPLPLTYDSFINQTQFVPTIKVTAIYSGYFGFEDSPAIPQVSKRWRKLLTLKIDSSNVIRIANQGAAFAGVTPSWELHLQERNTLQRTLFNDNEELYDVRPPDRLLCQSTLLNNTRRLFSQPNPQLQGALKCQNLYTNG